MLENEEVFEHFIMYLHMFSGALFPVLEGKLGLSVIHQLLTQPKTPVVIIFYNNDWQPSRIMLLRGIRSTA